MGEQIQVDSCWNGSFIDFRFELLWDCGTSYDFKLPVCIEVGFDVLLRMDQ